MKYVTWSVYFPEGQNEGYTPESIIEGRGYWAEGAFDISNFTSVAYTSDDADLSNLQDFNVQVITQEQALEYAQQIAIPNLNPYLNIEGKIIFPLPPALLEQPL